MTEVGIAELQDGMARGKWTSKWYFRRIEEIDRPGLNSVIEVNPEAGRIPEELERERKEKEARGGAPWDSGADQGQHRHCRPNGDDDGLAGAQGIEVVKGCVQGGAAAGAYLRERLTPLKAL